ncbi:MAG: glycosyltransferase family 2 protein [Betaproteobacteria bacterium]|nr:MAG: glycosyltransferase family 2 protein [Betaproteobacteria bacterium]
MTLSVILITKNEAERLPRCLESVRFADEIIVLDSGSTDATLEIARRYTDQVFISDGWPGFGPQKNAALSHASGDWVLSLDADEWLTPELAAEVQRVLAAPQADVYEIPRLSSFCGREMRHSGWWPDHVARLFRRGTARFSDDLVHERLLFTTHARRLMHPIRHETYRHLDEMLVKLNRYSTAGAQNQLDQGKRAGLGKAISRGLWAFLRTYIIRAGFLDGREGFLLAVANAETTYYRYLKLMYLVAHKD